MTTKLTIFQNKKLKFSTVFILLVFIGFGIKCPDICSGESIVLNSSKQMDFADHLFGKGDFDKAVAEYERFIFFFPDDKRVDEAVYKSGVSNYRNGKYHDAVRMFDKLIVLKPFGWDSFDSYKVKASFMKSRSYMMLGDRAASLLTLYNLSTQVKITKIKDRINYEMAWLELEGGKWTKAAKYFGQISEQGRSVFKISDLTEDLGKYDEINYKSPNLSGFLSVIPGGGYVYCGRYKDALISFLFNGGLIYAAVEAFDHDNNALGGVISFVEAGFYMGNIYGGVSAAHKYNRAQKLRFKDNLESKYRKKFKIGARPAMDGRGLAMVWGVEF